jgi:ActR/RegA family two-component response regulator/AraC-like DNA-binding protein
LIDDEIHSTDTLVMLMTLEGLAVECEASGIAGLQRALTETFDGIILDLRLPDLSGQAVLERLVAAGVSAPVLVLSGFAGFAEGVAAMKAGARDVRQKPIMGDELATLMEHVIRRERDSSKVRQLFTLSAGTSTDTADVSLMSVQLAFAMFARGLSPVEFVKLAESFRCLLTSDVRRNARRRPTRTESAGRKIHEEAESILRRMELGLAARRLPSQEEVADACGTSRRRLAAILLAATALEFSQCRRTLRLRPALSDVALGAEQFAQIAYRTGYEHPAQFDRDFVETFGLSPTAMRKLCSAIC